MITTAVGPTFMQTTGPTGARSGDHTHPGHGEDRDICHARTLERGEATDCAWPLLTRRAAKWGRLSYGPSYYAGSTFTDADGAPGLIHWLRGVADPAGQWAGAHSLPHRLALEGVAVVVRPHPVVTAARSGGATTVRDGVADVPWVVNLEWMFDAPEATATLTVAGDGRDQIRLDAANGNLLVRVGERSWDMPIVGRDLRVVVDGPVVEVFTAAGVTAAAVGSTGGRRDLGRA